MDLSNKRIIICKQTRIGDVMCCLPLVTVLKNRYPNFQILFLGQEYTRPLIETYNGIDEFIDYGKVIQGTVEESAINLASYKADIIVHTLPDKMLLQVAKKALIPLRIATASKFISWQTCNRLVLIRRRLGNLHESQYDMMFASALGFEKHYSLTEIIKLRNYKPSIHDAPCLALLDKNKFNLIIHMKGMTPVMLWPINSYVELIQILPKERFKIFLTGTEAERELIERHTSHFDKADVVNLCGKTTLTDLMQLIGNANGLIAGSTGPLHLAANFGIYALGIYPPIKPRHPARWGPIGTKSETLCAQRKCDRCRHCTQCECIAEITPQQVYQVISKWEKR